MITFTYLMDNNCYTIMIKNIIDLLNQSDYYGVSERIDIAKGMYQKPHTLKQAFRLVKRVWNG